LQKKRENPCGEGKRDKCIERREGKVILDNSPGVRELALNKKGCRGALNQS
jgi:hypothetical protein